MRRRVSGARPTVKVVAVKVVTVRQVPFMEMESPSCTSVRIGDGGGVEIVRFVPVGVEVSVSTARWRGEG